VFTQLRRCVEDAALREASDGLLLGRFLESRDEVAFTVLLRRHGPMVFGVCRRVLGNEDAAEDVFQATFLVLLRRAAAIRRRESLGSWLHGVAHRLAQHARADAARRRRHEGQVGTPTPADPFTQVDWQDLTLVVDEELSQLPDKYRMPLVLCHLEGRTLTEAARQLGWKDGTLAGRLARGRDLLGARLARRGVSLCAGLGAATLGGASLLADVPRPLFASTVRLASLLNGQEAAVCLAAPIGSLAERMVRSMFLKKVKVGVACLVASTCLALGAAVAARQALAGSQAIDSSLRAESAEKQAASAPRVDATGEPLPAEAVARLGSTRLKHGKGYMGNLLFTPDGKLLLSQSYQEALVWDTATGRLVRRFPTDAAFGGWDGSALSPDGKLLAAPGEKTMRLWDVATAREVRTIGKGRFVRVCFSPDGKLLASQGGNTFVHLNLWDVATGKNVRAWTVANGSDFACPALFTRDGKTLISGHRDNAVRFWDVDTGKERKKIALDLKSPRMLALSPDGKVLAVTAYQTPHIHLIDVAEARERARLLAPERQDAFGRKQGFSYVAFTPDSKALIAAGIDDSLILWDVTTGKERRRWKHGFTNLFALALSPDGTLIASAIFGKSIRLTNLASGRDRFGPAGHPHGIWSATFAANGTLAATVGGGNEIHLWGPTTGREMGRLTGHTAEVTWVGLSKDGRHVVSHGADKTTRFWDLATRKEARKIEIAKSEGWFSGVFTADARAYVHFARKPGNKNAIQFVDVATGKERWSITGAHPWWCGAAFTPDEKTLVAWSADLTVYLLEPATGKQRKQYRIPDDSGPMAPDARYLSYTLVLSPDGKMLGYGSQRRSSLLLETATGKVLHRLSVPDPQGVSSIAFSPNGKMLAWGGWQDPTVHLIELATGKERHRFVAQGGRVYTLAFSPSSTALLSATGDTTAVVWDLTGRHRQIPTWGKPLTGADLEAIWADLAGDDATRAYLAVQKLAGSPKDGVAYLGKRLQPVPVVEEKLISRLINDLDSDDFNTREQASRELDKLGEGALGACEDALAGKPSLEVRRRLEAYRNKVAYPSSNLSREQLWTIRALEALEMCNTAEARAVLTALAKGARGAYLTTQARAALKRVSRQR
jgi:RNA polymerase sigma factor (sigma-70 family)